MQSRDDSYKEIKNKTFTTKKNIGKTKETYHDERNGDKYIVRKKKAGKT